eukprot:1470350-Rhodomonas_salina.1
MGSRARSASTTSRRPPPSRTSRSVCARERGCMAVEKDRMRSLFSSVRGVLCRFSSSLAAPAPCSQE